MKPRIFATVGLCLLLLALLPGSAQHNDDPRDVDLFALQTAVVEKICLFENLRAVHHYELSYDAYIRNHQAYPDAGWIDERYPYPEPGMACVVGVHEDFGYPIPVKSDTPVCEANPPYQKPEPAPSGEIVFAYPIPASWGIPEIVGCYNAVGSTAILGTGAVYQGRDYYLMRFGQGPFAPKLWCPVKE